MECWKITRLQDYKIGRWEDWKMEFWSNGICRGRKTEVRDGILEQRIENMEIKKLKNFVILLVLNFCLLCFKYY